MKPAVIAFGALASAVLVGALALPQEVEVRREATLAAPPHAVAAQVADLSTWPRWAPWDATDAQVTASLERGVWFDLERDRDLVKGALLLEEEGEGTRATWILRTRPSGGLFGRFRGPALRAWLGRELQGGFEKLAGELATE